MKKIIIIALFSIGFSTASYSQGKEKSGSFFSRIFHGGAKTHKQMSHFGKQKADPNISNNGTSFRQNRKSGYKVDGDGFGTSKQGSRRRRKKNGIK